MPIPEDFKFWCTGGECKIGTSEWTFADVDQRRMVTVRMDGNLEPEEQEDVAFEHFKRHIDSLGPDVVWIHVGPGGDLISTSSNPIQDPTSDMYYPPLDLIQRPADVQAILRSGLRELDRLMSSVDLVSYQTEGQPAVTRKAVFKYYWQYQFVEKQWDEMNVWMRLPHHPNIVPFDRLVLDEVRGGVVGFTTLYIPGGTLENNVSRTFKLKWCQQLMQVVDDLNLRYGIAHQDIVPRNLLVDEATDNIMLFDFNTAAQIGHDRGPPFFWHWYVNLALCPPPFRKVRAERRDRDIRDDVKAVIFTIYEMITRDFHFREGDWQELDPSMVQDIEWVPHPDATLDRPVTEYRALLNAWVKARGEGKKITIYTDAPEYIDWPLLEVPTVERTDRTGRVYNLRTWHLPRHESQARGENVIKWQRPKCSTLKGDYHLLASGTFLDGA